MKNLKKLLAVLLAGLMLLSLAACGGNKKDEKMLGVVEAEGFTASLINHDAEKHPNVYIELNTKSYSNLSTAILDLQNGKITSLGCEETVAEYILARNEGYVIGGTELCKTDFSMMIKDTNTEVYDILNNAIKEMKDDGTLDSLIQNELKAHIESDPVAKDLPKFEDAVTIKIGVTGDMPPMDYVASNGKAAGFNIALLAEIANRAQVNFELVQIETGSRPMALSSGKVDAVFWTRSITCVKCSDTFVEEIAGTLVTESYFSDASVIIMPKSDK